VVFGDDEFPSVVYAALALERRGVKARAVPVRDHLSAADLLNAIDRRTRAVVASHVHWQTGHRIDLSELGSGCRAAGPLSIIDAIQSLGAVPTDLSASGVDVLVAGSYKWLFAIPGAAVLYAGERAVDAVTPDRAGWRSMETSVYDRPRLAWAAGARRFEAGGQPDPTLVALDRSVELLLEVGVERIYRRALGAIDRLLAGIDGTGLLVRSSLQPAHRSTIVSVSTGRPDEDDRLTRALADARIIVARRGAGIRIAPHWHNRDQDIDRAIEVVRVRVRVRV
jgi:selenocysteine lyase/cysteine desulfurase